MSSKKSVISNEFSKRLLSLIEKVGFVGRQNSKFANKIGVSSSFLSDVINLKSGPSFGLLYGISKNFPEVNMNWLLTGEGPFYLNIEGESPGDGSPSIAKEIEAQHMHLVKGFRDKQRALDIDQGLIELEKLDTETFRRVESYIRGTVDAVRERTEKSPYRGIERRIEQQRAADDPSQVPDGIDRRSGEDRRKAG